MVNICTEASETEIAALKIATGKDTIKYALQEAMRYIIEHPIKR